MALLDKREVYRPFCYPQAFDFFLKQQQAHWIWTEVNMSSDIKDYNEFLTEDEKKVIIRILRLFTQTEITVEEYWTNKVVKWFPHAEVQQMASTFGAFEAIHISAYDYLNQSLGLPVSEYEEFLTEPSMKKRQDRLSDILNNTSNIESIAKSLAVFSAFTEGVSLFSSFAVLMNFARFNKLKGVRDIVSWSSRDEELHSSGGIYLFNTLKEEYPHIWTDDFKKEIYQAARDTIELEDAYIDYVFNNVNIEGINKEQLKAYIRHRANVKLNDIGLKSNWKGVDKQLVKDITDWYDVMLSGNIHKDFFSGRSSSYSKGHIDWNSINFQEFKYND